MKKLSVVLSLSLCLAACVNANPKKDVSSDEKAKVYLKMGVRYMEIGQLGIAKENLEKALDFDSSNANIHNAIAVLYERIKRFDDAKYHYQKAVSLDEENPQPKNNYGRFLCELGDYQGGLAHLNVALNMPLNRRKWFALTNAGICKVKEGNSQQAEAYFREALNQNPNYAPALMEMQKISYHQRNYMSARAFLQRYLSVAPENAETLWYAYQNERSLGNSQKAEEYRSKLLNKFPNSAEAKKIQ